MFWREELRKTIRSLLYHTLTKAITEKLDVLRKGGHDLPAAKKKLKEAMKALDKEDFREAFEDISLVRYYVMETPYHTTHLVEKVFDPLMDALWDLWQRGNELSERRRTELVRKAKRLMGEMEECLEEPRGKEKANPPTRVKTPRDARLWEVAKRVVRDQYGDEDEEKYWAIVSRVFTRMKIRAGGRPEEEVERAVKYLQEKYGEVVPATEKRKKEIVEVMEGEKD